MSCTRHKGWLSVTIELCRNYNAFNSKYKLHFLFTHYLNFHHYKKEGVKNMIWIDKNIPRIFFIFLFVVFNDLFLSKTQHTNNMKYLSLFDI